MPITAIMAPITSSLRSPESDSHQEGESAAGWERGEAFPRFEEVLPEDEALFDLEPPLDFLDEENGVLSGMLLSEYSTNGLFFIYRTSAARVG